MNNRIKIGIDARMFNGKPTGIGRYIEQLVSYFYQFNVEIYFYSNKSIKLPSGFHGKKVEDTGVFKFLPGFAWLKYILPYYIVRDKIDIFLGGNTLLPLWVKCKLISVVHDLNHVLVPATMPIFNRISYKLFFFSDINRCHYLVCNSFATKDRLSCYVNVENALVIRPRLSDLIRCMNGAIVAHRDDYILSVATREPRKNIKGLINAFIELKKDQRFSKTKLVLVGGVGWGNILISEQNYESISSDIVHAGYVDDSRLIEYYKKARVFVFPSFYEGFGIPVIEALAFGTPVVTTDIPELREAGGDHCIYVEPSANGIKNGIIRALSINEFKPVLRDFDFDYSKWLESIEFIVKSVDRDE
jgi:glycosyltransferase involved in cell wall biosynthesis